MRPEALKQSKAKVTDLPAKHAARTMSIRQNTWTRLELAWHSSDLQGPLPTAHASPNGNHLDGAGFAVLCVGILSKVSQPFRILSSTSSVLLSEQEKYRR